MDEIIEAVTRAASGDYSAQFALSGEDYQLDRLAKCVNMLIAKLREKEEERKESEEKLRQIADDFFWQSEEMKARNDEFEAYSMLLLEQKDELEKRTKETLEANKRLEKTQKELEEAEHERNKYIEELREALKKVKQLGGMLPICSHCKKVRDDKGYWNQIESYIHEHSEAKFSHSICQECAKKYYSDMDLYDEDENQE